MYKLIRKKESLFGNLFLQKYRDVEHTSELFSMRLEISKKVDEYKRKRKRFMGSHGVTDIMWRGISYGEILKIEKLEIEERIKDEIRVEME